jgi:Flp pilus assembly pilin Flp
VYRTTHIEGSSPLGGVRQEKRKRPMTNLHTPSTRLSGSKLARKQRGAATVEYAVLIGILLMCGFAMWRYFFKSVSHSVQNSSEMIQQTVGGDGQHAGRKTAEGAVAQP